MEKWKSIKRFENLYEISNMGNIKSLGNKKNHSKIIYLKKGEKTGVFKNGISKCCRNELKTSGGYKWKYGINSTK